MFSKILVPKILIIERNEQILNILLSCIENSCAEIESVRNLKDIKDKSFSKYTLIIADLGLKEVASTTLIRSIHDTRSFIPTIFLGENRLEDKILSCKLGINIYHEKPIKCELLKAQINQLSFLFNHNMILDLATLKVDLSSQGIISSVGFIPLTGREFNLLMLLIRAGGRVLSPKQIINFPPFEEEGVTETAIHTIVSRIRTKLKGRIMVPLILTRHQAGYSINYEYLKNLHLKLES
jgi:DNA-binding response OmpR family regulator